MTLVPLCTHPNKTCHGFHYPECEQQDEDRCMCLRNQRFGVWHSCFECGFNWGATSDYGRSHICQDCGNKAVEPNETYTYKSIEYETKDSGVREEYESGMVRDTQAGKPRFDLMLPRGVPYEAQFLSRVAALLGRGAEKYEDRNWEKAEGEAELERFKASAQRHLMQWLCDESDEDHAAAVVFNLLAYETIKWKRDNVH